MTDDTPSPLSNVITIDDERIKSHLDRVVRGSVEGHVPSTKVGEVAAMLKAIYASDASRLRARRLCKALNLAGTRLRHIAGSTWSSKRYLNIEPLKDQQMRDAITA